jgi:hypothetical protein
VSITLHGSCLWLSSTGNHPMDKAFGRRKRSTAQSILRKFYPAQPKSTKDYNQNRGDLFFDNITIGFHIFFLQRRTSPVPKYMESPGTRLSSAILNIFGIAGVASFRKMLRHSVHPVLLARGRGSRYPRACPWVSTLTVLFRHLSNILSKGVAKTAHPPGKNRLPLPPQCLLLTEVFHLVRYVVSHLHLAVYGRNSNSR